MRLSLLTASAAMALLACDQPFLGQLPEIQPSNEMADSCPAWVPTGLRGVVQTDRIELSWDLIAGNDGYLLERAPNGGVWERVDETGAVPLLPVVDHNIAKNAFYLYRVRGSLGGCASEPSPEVTLFSEPEPVASLLLQAQSPSEILISWSHQSRHLSRFELQRRGPTDDQYVPLEVTLASGSTSHFDSDGIEPDTQYYYRIIAFSQAGDYAEMPSAPAEANRWSRPLPVTQLIGAALSPSEVQLSWSEPSGSVLGYHIRRSPPGADNFNGFADPPAGITEYTVTALEPGEAYDYRVVLVGEGGEAEPAEVMNLRSSTPPTLSWGASPTLDNSCLLDIPGTSFTDDAAGATLASVSGTIAHAVEPVVADTAGLRATLGELVQGALRTTWSLTDALGLNVTLERDLDLSLIDPVYATGLGTPAATLGHDTGVGRQIMHPAEESVPTTGCAGCGGLRGSLALGAYFSCALGREGGVWCWGKSQGGLLGGGHFTYNAISIPQQVCVEGVYPAGTCVPMLGAVSISAGFAHTCALLEDGGVRCWGANSCGQVGRGGAIGPAEYLAAEVCLTGFGPSCDPLRDAVAVSAGGLHSCALRTGGQIWCWGSNEFGQIGNATYDTSANLANPVPVCESVSGPDCNPLTGMRAVFAQGRSTCAIDGGGQILCWGADSYGQLGDGEFVNGEIRMTPAPVCAPGATAPCDASPFTNARSLSGPGGAVCAIDASGDTFCWGSGYSWQRGDGGGLDEYSPDPMPVCGVDDTDPCTGALPPVRSISLSGMEYTNEYYGKGHACALLEEGRIACWGRNGSGQAGTGRLGTNVHGKDERVPQYVKAMPASSICADGLPLEGVVAVETGGLHSCALTEQGHIYCWGINDKGCLGDGTDGTAGDALRCAAVPVCASGSGLDCERFEGAAIRACGSAQISVP